MKTHKRTKSPKWILASNRLPFSWDSKALKLTKSSGGLVTAISGIKADIRTVWVGVSPEGITKEEWTSLKKASPDNKAFEAVFVSDSDYDNYYNGMCNNVLWPLLHYESSYVSFNQKYWNSYLKINQQFAKKILKISSPGDLVWIHDLHLMLVPHFLKKENKKLKVGFFLHTPFPSFEIFTQLPVREKIMNSLLQTDLIGFHDYSYLRHFIASTSHILGIDSSGLSIKKGDHTCHLGVFPVSIDTQGFKKAATSKAVLGKERLLRKEQNLQYLILGVDRLDYIKGIELKLKAFRAFLEHYPEMRGKVSLLQIAIPSRTEVPRYQSLRSEIERLVGEINGKFSRPHSIPVQYIYSSVSFEKLLALYRCADALLVTSKRDGMNLVALEYLATQPEHDPGVVILSEFTGAISTLSRVQRINPWDIDGTAQEIYKALSLSQKERVSRHKEMIQYLNNYTATSWAASFMKMLQQTTNTIEQEKSISLDSHEKIKLFARKIKEQGRGKFLIFFADYDGTLTPIVSTPEKAHLTPAQKKIIRSLTKNERSKTIIISGRSKEFLFQEFKRIDISFASEHGAELHNTKLKTHQRLVINPKSLWYDEALSIMKNYTKRVQNSFIEKKKYAVVWHFRNAPSDFAEFQSRKLKKDLEIALLKSPVIIQAGKKIIEVKASEANKGSFALWYLDKLKKNNYGVELLPIAIGDDTTDEDLFQAVKTLAGISIKVGSDNTCADFRLSEQKHVYLLLKEFIK